MKVRLSEDLRVTDLGDEAVVLDPAGEQVHRVAGEAVQVLRLLAAAPGRDVDVPEALRAGLDHLVEAGVVDAPTSWSRRKVLMAGGATWAAATVSTFGLADPAAATTLCDAGITPTTTPQTYTTVGSTGMFTTGPGGPGMGTYSLLIRAWGGGGGGGGSAVNSTGGGGGGGEYRGGDITVTECTTYTIAVGEGGMGGGNPGDGGGPSWFGPGPTSAGALLHAMGGTGGMQIGYQAYSPGGAGGTGGTGGTGYNGGTGGTGQQGNLLNNNAGGGGGGGAGGSGGAGGAGGDGSNSAGGAVGTGGSGSPGGGAGGMGGRSSAGAGTAPGGGGGGGGEATLGTVGGAGARGEVWVGH